MDFDLMKASNENWRRSDTRNFWEEIAPRDHVVQIYDDEQIFLDLLEGFITGGFAANDCVIIIATEEHLVAMEHRLKLKGYNLFEKKLQDQYIPLNARETLDEFMINDWPDEVLFRHVIGRLISRARSRNRNVRAFGEMVAQLWMKGYTAATVKLEHLWNKMCENEKFGLFCAYPRSFFNQSALESILHICECHSKMITVPERSRQEILYKEVEFDGNRRRTG